MTTKIVKNPLDMGKFIKKSIAILAHGMAAIGVGYKGPFVFILLTLDY